MSSLNSSKGRKIHTRNIEISTYESGGENIIAEGILKEDRLIAFYHNFGEKHPPQTVHNMVIQMLVECSSLTITHLCSFNFKIDVISTGCLFEPLLFGTTDFTFMQIPPF